MKHRRKHLLISRQLSLGGFHFEPNELSIDTADDVGCAWRAEAHEGAVLGLERTGVAAKEEAAFEAEVVEDGCLNFGLFQSFKYTASTKEEVMRIKEMDVVLMLTDKMPREWQMKAVRHFTDFVQDWDDQIRFEIDDETWTQQKLGELALRFDIVPKKKSRPKK